MIERLTTLPLQNNPGEKYNYSISVDVLGALIERVSGSKLSDFFKENIFTPLGMNDTHFKIPSSKINRFCSYYTKNLRLKEKVRSNYRN